MTFAADDTRGAALLCDLHTRVGVTTRRPPVVGELERAVGPHEAPALILLAVLAVLVLAGGAVGGTMATGGDAASPTRAARRATPRRDRAGRDRAT